MKYVSVLIVVDDVARSRLLYENILHQKVAADYGEDVAFKGGFTLHQKEHFRQLIDGRPVCSESNNFELFFEENDLDAIVQELKLNGFEFIHEIRVQPWKQRVIRFYDNDRNIVEIGESMEYTAYRLYLENLSIKEISQITYLSVRRIKTVIEKFGH